MAEDEVEGNNSGEREGHHGRKRVMTEQRNLLLQTHFTSIWKAEETRDAKRSRERIYRPGARGALVWPRIIALEECRRCWQRGRWRWRQRRRRGRGRTRRSARSRGDNPLFLDGESAEMSFFDTSRFTHSRRLLHNKVSRHLRRIVSPDIARTVEQSLIYIFMKCIALMDIATDAFCLFGGTAVK